MKYISLLLLIFTHLVFAETQQQNSDVNKYFISDIDMQIFIRQMNNIEQCIYPDLNQPNFEEIYQSWTLVEQAVMEYYKNKLIESLIGKENLLKLKNDDESFRYFINKQRKFNHQNANLDPELCRRFKLDYHQKLVQAQKIVELSQQKQNK